MRMQQPAYTVSGCRKNLEAMSRVVRKLWVQMCNDVGISPEEKFVELSLLEASKYHKFYDLAIQKYWDMKRQFDCGGYV